MAVIAVGGFQHETNTFAPYKADYAAFEKAGDRPALAFGDKVKEAVFGANIPAAGALDQLHALGHKTIGLVWGAATPSAHVTRSAYERIVGELLIRLNDAGPVDAVYLDLHGAMVAEHHNDGEGELLARVRSLVGKRVAIVASLDLHANVSRSMVELADGLTAYRTYPHVDMANTGRRAAQLIQRTLELGHPLPKAYETLSYLTSIPSQCTLIEPCKKLYHALSEMESQNDIALSFTPGFPMADSPDCGMAVFGYSKSVQTARAMVEILARQVAQSERDFVLELLNPDQAVRRAMECGELGAPVVIADTQDNPGAGGVGDTTGLLSALLRHNAKDAALGLLIDPASAAQAHSLGVGEKAVFQLGERSALPGHSPVVGEFKVEALNDGNFTCTGPYAKGFRMQLGPMALLRSVVSAGVQILLASKLCQATDQAMFRHLGVEPKRQRILVLKSSVHFRADFQPIAKEVIVARAPGPALVDPADFKWTQLRKGMRLGPLGPVFEGK